MWVVWGGVGVWFGVLLGGGEWGVVVGVWGVRDWGCGV